MSLKLYGNTSKRAESKTPPENEGDLVADKPVVTKKEIWKRVVAVFAIILIAAGGAFAVLHNAYIKPPEVTPSVTNNGSNGTQLSVSSGARKGNYFTFLLCGTDEGDTRTDTIMVASYDIDNGKINIVSIPRDTMLNETWTVKKINSAYAILGIDLLKDELARILGFQIDYYAVVNLNAFKEIVDAIGGVDFDVPVDMYYEDPTQDLLINLKAGPQHLNGEKSMELIRYRSYVMADIQRVSVQQDFMRAVFSQIVKLGNITKISEIAVILQKYMITDLTVGNVLWLSEKAVSVKADNISTFTLPGTPGPFNGGSYWQLNAQGVVDLMNQYFNPGIKDIALGDVDIVTVVDGYIVSSTGKKVYDTSRSNDYEEEAPEVTPTPTPSATPRPTPSATPTPSVTPKPSSTPTPSSTPSTSPTPTATPSTSPTATPKPTATPTPTVTP